jgi:hypothetical protein
MPGIDQYAKLRRLGASRGTHAVGEGPRTRHIRECVHYCVLQAARERQEWRMTRSVGSTIRSTWKRES